MSDTRIEALRPRRDGLDGAYEGDLEARLAKAIPDLRIEEMFRWRPGLLQTYDHLLIRWAPDGAMAGVLGCTWRSCADLSLLHVGIQMIAPRYRRSGLFVELWRHEITEVLPSEDRRPSLVGVKTYNPIVYMAMRTFAKLAAGQLYPDVYTDDQDPEFAWLAARTSAVLAPGREFNASTGAIYDVGMPPDLYEDIPTAEGHTVGLYFERHLHPGDRLLCLLRLPGFDELDSAHQLFRSLATMLRASVNEARR